MIPIKHTTQNLVIGRRVICPGQTLDMKLKISESVLGTTISLPLKVIRSVNPGPVLLVLAGIHGDEMNGVGIVRDLMLKPPKLRCGTLILLPIVNVFGFEENSRYLPDRRDLNRCFPGKKNGALGSRIAFLLTKSVIGQCTAVIDLHTGAFPRTNYPHIRADLSQPAVKALADAFQSPLTFDTKGEPTTLRHWASRNHIPTICYEGGETNRFEPHAMKAGLQGIRNVLKQFNMIQGELTLPPFKLVIKTSSWIRSDTGGILQIKVKCGQVVSRGTIIASCLSLHTKEKVDIFARSFGIVVGLTTRPTIKPGEPVCNFAHISDSVALTMLNQNATVSNWGAFS